MSMIFPMLYVLAHEYDQCHVTLTPEVSLDKYMYT